MMYIQYDNKEDTWHGLLIYDWIESRVWKSMKHMTW